MPWMYKLRTFSIALVSVFMLLLSGCMPDECKDKTCENGAACVNGACICPDWFEGENCEKRISQRFTGAYAGPYNCASLSDIVLTVTESAEVINQINLTNFQLTGTLTAQNKFDIPEQDFIHPVTGAVLRISGNGSVNEGRLLVNFRGVNDPSFICSFQGTVIL